MLLRSSFLVSLSVALGLIGVLVGTESRAQPAYDAAFVNLVAPERVTAREVFPVTITMRNTGTQTWEGPSIRLRGASTKQPYLGNRIRPDCSRHLRESRSGVRIPVAPEAPADLGKLTFQWQICKDGEKWFGEVTPAKTIEVVAGQTRAPRRLCRTQRRRRQEGLGLR